MTPTLDQLQEAKTALGAPLFSDLPGDIDISFEFFPPKTEKMAEPLWDSVATLSPLGPRFVSVTYGAGGSTRERTHEQVVRIQNEAGIPAAAHLTCVNATREEVDEVARHYWKKASAISSPCAAIRLTALLNTHRIPAATPMQRN